MTQAIGEVAGSAREATVRRAVADNARHERISIRKPVHPDGHEIQLGLGIRLPATFDLLRSFSHWNWWLGDHCTHDRERP